MSSNSLLRRKQAAIAALALVAIVVHLILRFGAAASATAQNIPLWIALALGGVPLVWELAVKLFRREFGSDLLAGISIVTSVLLDEYLAGTLVVLMLSGGETLEAYAVRSASSVLAALAKRMPTLAHRKVDSTIADVPLTDLAIGDTVLIFPHEVCPIDGTVVEGHGVMDESYLTGEPYLISKTPGSTVLSGAINGESALTIRADKLAVDSRYAKIMEVMRASEQHQPRVANVDRPVERRNNISPAKDLASPASGDPGRGERDRLVVMVRDPYWLQVFWELSRQSIDRAQSAMGPHWHTAAPVLRLYKMGVDGTSALVRHIPIHGGVSHWYVDVQDPPHEFRLEIGYLASGGQFFSLARSNSVTTPRASSPWANSSKHSDSRGESVSSAAGTSIPKVQTATSGQSSGQVQQRKWIPCLFSRRTVCISREAQTLPCVSWARLSESGVRFDQAKSPMRSFLATSEIQTMWPRQSQSSTNTSSGDLSDMVRRLLR